MISPINSEPYTSWTTVGAIVTQCGIPQIIHDVDWSIRRLYELKYLSNIQCISDILG